MNNNDSLVYKKAFEFSKRVVKLYEYLNKEKKEYTLSKQVLRSGTNIGANIKEGKYAQSKKDFISKMSIALKEAGESEYWIELLMETGYLSTTAGKSILNDLVEIIKMLASIVKTTKSSVKS